MGRRAVPKYSPKLELEPYLKEFEQLPSPWDATKLFGREAPLEVELGSGKGLFMETNSNAYPERNFLGLEIAKKYARYSAAKLAKKELSNAIMVPGDGLKVFREILPTEGVTAVHVYFPDPWWKRRHRKRRVVNEDFLKETVRVLVPGGKLHFWTDVKEYFDVSLKLIAEVTDLRGPLDVPERPPEHTMDYQTHFERRTRMHDQPVYRSEFEKLG